MSGAEKYKLTKQEIEEIQADTTTSHSVLGRKYDVDHTTIIHHRRKAGQKPKYTPHYKDSPNIKRTYYQAGKIIKIKCSLCGVEIERNERKVMENNFCCQRHCKVFHGQAKPTLHDTPQTKQEEDYNYYVELDKNRVIKRDSVGNII